MQFPPIVMLTAHSFPHIGGLEIAVLNFARILSKHGHKVYIIAPMNIKMPEYEIIDGIPIFRFPFDWNVAYTALVQNLGTNKFRSNLIQEIKSILNKIGKQVIIHAHGEAVIAAGWLKEWNNDLKLVYTPHSSPNGLKDLLQTKIFGKLYFQPSIEKVDIIAYHSTNLISELKELEIDLDKIREIINFIDPTLFNPSEYDKISCRRILNLPENSRIIFSPSRLDEEKGLIELVCTLPIIIEKYPDVYLYIAGDLEYGFMIDPSDLQHKILRKVRKILPEYVDRVRFTGAIPYHIMPKWYSAADVIVLISRDECMPMCILEAMAMEKPIVATKIGCIPELLENCTGRLIEISTDGKASPKVVANALIEELAQNKNKVISLKNLREKIFHNFSPEAGYQKLKAIYTELSEQV
ncbi:MAG: glycosyltransferase family 4 protein [Promethearchaeota archaeon]